MSRATARPRPVPPTVRGGVGRPEELLEDVLRVLRTDADAVVGDGDDGIRPVGAHRDPHLAFLSANT